MTDPSVLVAIVAGVAAIVGAIFSYRASTRATSIESSKVDAAAFERAKSIYEGSLRELERQLERMREQFDRVNAQLATEQDTSSALRSQLRTLRSHVEELERTVNDLRLQLTLAGIKQNTSTEGGA